MFHNTQVQPSTAATNEQIGAALQILFNSMRFPPGVDAAKAIFGYMQALEGMPIEAITEGIRKFLRGECEGVNPKFCPHPPELSAIVRGTMSSRPRLEAEGKVYGYHPPKTNIIERRCTKDWARQLVNQGVHPRGSIWCPGALSSGDGERGKPEIGDLYAPDPEWKNAFPLRQNAA